MKLFISFLFLISPIFTVNIFACQCLVTPTVRSIYDSSTVVFTGKAVKTNYQDVEEESRTNIIYEFEIDKVFKGNKVNKLTVNVGPKSMCSGELPLNRSYLIYANGKDSLQITGGLMCGLTDYLENAQDQIFFINEIIAGKPESQFYGSVLFPQKTNDTFQNFKFYIEKDKKKIGIVTDKNGIFKVGNLAKGIYTVHIYEESNYQFQDKFSFRVLESGKAFNLNWSSSSLAKKTENEVERIIRESNEIFPMYSNGVYYEIFLTQKR